MARVFLQKKAGEFVSINGYVAWDGFRLLGYELCFFEYDAIDQLPLDPETVVHGSVGAVHRALARMGRELPDLHPAPPALAPFYGRRVWEGTMAEARRQEGPVFLKPLRAHKAFTGYVRKGDLDDISRTAHLDDDFPVVLSEVVPIASEWRCFVLDGRCVGARPYAGLYNAPTPDPGLVHGCIEALGSGAPAAYSVDLARLVDGRTVVIEVNDAYALGAYGLPSIPYAQMIEARWGQLTGLTPWRR
jgi:hypothetical protein